MKSELLCESGGCSAKLSAQKLDELLRDIPVLRPENLLVGIDTHDDAAVWKINDETAIIQTTDFFPAVCSDPYTFGRIAAANAISDVYAMGGNPILALNIVMYPAQEEGLPVLADILRGGAEKTAEAGAALAGGHTIDDAVPKYGLAVTGTVHPDRVITNSAAKPGELLILTKPLGTGIVLAGKRLGECGDDVYQNALESMMRLNKNPALIMTEYGIRCATDITGFGLIGHSLKMARGSNVTIEIDSLELPLLPGAYELSDSGCIPTAAFRNLKFSDNEVHFSEHVDYSLKMTACDAQTSGGILMCVTEDRADAVLSRLKDSDELCAVVIGKTMEHREGEKWVRLK